MSWLYSQALVEEYSEGNFLDGEQYVQLSGNRTQQAYCSPDRMTKFSRLSRFGMTYKPLTDDLGKELLTLYLEGFRAKTFQVLEKAQESMEIEVRCGTTWRESLAKFDHDTHSWKIPHSLLGEGYQEFSETWPRWGTMRNGECLAAPILPRHPDAKGYGFLPAATKSDAKVAKEFKASSCWKNIQTGRQVHLMQLLMVANTPLKTAISLIEKTMIWPMGWTDLQPLATAKFRHWLHSHGKPLLENNV